MAYKIKMSKEFLRNILAIQAYIENEWGLKSAEKFQTILDSKIDNLSIYPKIGSPTKNKNIRKITITKHNKVYYKIKAGEIFILALFETKERFKINLLQFMFYI